MRGFGKTYITLKGIDSLDSSRYIYSKIDGNSIHIGYDFAQPKKYMIVKNQNNNTKTSIEQKCKGLPKEIIFNGDATIVNYGENEKIVLHKDKEDEYDPTYAFLYAYFIHNSGMSKTQSAKFLDNIMENACKKEIKVQDKINEVAETIGKNLDFDTYVKEMNRILDKGLKKSK